VVGASNGGNARNVANLHPIKKRKHEVNPCAPKKTKYHHYNTETITTISIIVAFSSNKIIHTLISNKPFTKFYL
jgi:hypothetical protein